MSGSINKKNSKFCVIREMEKGKWRLAKYEIFNEKKSFP